MTIILQGNVICMGSAADLVLKNVTLPEGRVADIIIRDGLVAHAGSAGPAARIIDCSGCLVLPAAVDMHVHMRGGSQSAKEDWETGTKSALAGGVTVVVDQPNTLPPLTSPGLFRERVREAQAHAYCRFAINSSVTPNTPLREMWEAGAMAFGETFFAPSSYGEAISSPELSRALATIHGLGALATIHAEEIRPGLDQNLEMHAQVRSGEGEVQAVRNVGECNTRACRLHFCHMSTAQSIDAAAGTVEVTPHHLFLSKEKFHNDDARGKVNPPLRSETERKALFSRWNRIYAIASDHAPHTRDEKHLPFDQAPSGIPGVETMVPLLMAQVLEKRLALDDVIMKTSWNPSVLLGICPAGFTPGNRADFAIYRKKPVRIRADMLHSRCGWTPYEGHFAVFPEQVIMGGECVFNNGEFVRGDACWLSGNGYLSGA